MFKSVQQLVNVLIFYQVTQLLYGEKYASRSLILPARAFLIKMMKPSMQDEEFARELEKDILTQMNHYFNKYDFVGSDQLKAASFLDPSHKDSNFIAEDQRSAFIKEVARHIQQKVPGKTASNYRNTEVVVDEFDLIFGKMKSAFNLQEVRTYNTYLWTSKSFTRIMVKSLNA